MALYDTMLSLKSPIGTHCLGFAFNLAGFILAAGEKVLLLSIVFLLTICGFNMLKYNAYFCCSVCIVIKGSRTGMPLCRISVQSPAGAARGQVCKLNCSIWEMPTFYSLDLLDLYLQADDIENEANELIRIKNYLYGKLAEHTGHSVEKVGKSDYMIFFLIPLAVNDGLVCSSLWYLMMKSHRGSCIIIFPLVFRNFSSSIPFFSNIYLFADP